MLLGRVIPSRARDFIICTGHFLFSSGFHHLHQISVLWQFTDGFFSRWPTGFDICEDKRLATQESALFVGMDYRMYAGLAEHVSFNVFAFFFHFFLNVSAIRFLMWNYWGWYNYPTTKFFSILFFANCSKSLNTLILLLSGTVENSRNDNSIFISVLW